MWDESAVGRKDQEAWWKCSIYDICRSTHLILLFSVCIPMEIMSRNDLNFIQMQLKVAIQNHQTLVAKMKTDPQNLVIQKQLHEVQSQIQTLSEKQKSVVQQLRKELVSKQTPAPTVQPVQKPAPTTQLSIIRKPVIQNKPLPQQQQNKQLPQQQQNKPLPQQQQQQNKPPVQQTIKPKSVNNNNISKATVNDILNSQSGDQKNNSPLKVPTYQAAHKPTLLQTGHGTRGILKVQQQNNSLPSSPRKKTPTEMCEPYSFAQKCILNKKTGLQADEKEKLEYMASLDLITQDTLKDLQSRRTERKRRSTANPQFSYSSMEPERKRTPYLASKSAAKPAPPKERRTPPSSPSLPKKRGRPPKLKTVRGRIASMAKLEEESPTKSTEERRPIETHSSSTTFAVIRPNTTSYVISAVPNVINAAPSVMSATPNLISIVPKLVTHYNPTSFASATSSFASSAASFATSAGSSLSSTSHKETPSSSQPGDIHASINSDTPVGAPLVSRESLDDDVFQNDDSCSSQKDVHEDFCAICRRSGELLMCDTCSLVYHLNCLDPPLIAVPTGIWSCPKCKGNNVDVDKLSGSMAMVHSQIQARAAKENLKKQLQLKKQALLSDKVVLQDKTKQLSETIKEQIARRSELVNNTHTTQQNVDKLKNVIKVLQS